MTGRAAVPGLDGQRDPVVEAAMAEHWYYTGGDGKVCGPISADSVRQLVAAGELQADAEVWADQPDREKAAEVRKAGELEAGAPPGGVPDWLGDVARSEEATNTEEKAAKLDWLADVEPPPTPPGSMPYWEEHGTPRVADFGLPTLAPDVMPHWVPAPGQRPRPDAPTVIAPPRAEGETGTGEVRRAGGEGATAGLTPGKHRVSVPGYEVLDVLGEGGMGVVFKARDLALGRLVALKFIKHAAYAGPTERRRFEAEAESIARLQHPNIVQIYEVGEHDGLPYFALEFCPGGSLDKKLAGKPLPPEEAAALVEKLAAAVHAAHGKGVVHRDLKPGNVLLAEDGTPKITDFGLAKRLDVQGQKTSTGVVMGTAPYMSPEQAGGTSKAVGPATDVYALGAVLYECLTGRPPFQAASSFDTILQVIRDPPTPPSRLNLSVPRDLEAICLKCLEKDPKKRYASAADLAEDLRRYREAEPVQARPPGRLRRLARQARRRKELLYLVGGALVGALLLGALAAWTDPEAFWPPAMPHKVSQYNLDKIKVGMREQEVRKLMGKPNDETAFNLNTKTLEWRDGASYIRVTVIDGKIFTVQGHIR
jgi:hypothetical protein